MSSNQLGGIAHLFRMSKPNLAPRFTFDGRVATSAIDHDLCQYFLALINSISVVLKIFKSNEEIEVLANSLWNKFVKNYTPQSSKGFLAVGKRKTDHKLDTLESRTKEGEYRAFIERTGRNPSQRVAEWGNREMKFSVECADFVFCETFTHALFNKIRVHRPHMNNNTKMEVEWFDATLLTWENFRVILSQVCIFVQAIKSQRRIEKIDINSAPLAQLKTLPLVGNKIANNIISTRNTRLFTDFKDLEKRVPKLGIGTINAFRDFVFFGNDENQFININTASVETLKSLPKIGDVLSKSIIDTRTKSPFIQKEELKKVSGIGNKIYSAVENLITI